MIETVKLDVDRARARDLYRDYKKHQHYTPPIDAEIRRTYQLIAQGRVVIKAIESVVKAGLNEQKLPKLAIARADMPRCRLLSRADGSITMTADQRHWRRNNARSSLWQDFSAGSFPGVRSTMGRNHEALVPEIPERLRPKRGLENYHVLWEADWAPVVSKDPLLLRRIGPATDLWLVVAAWDLTDVEQIVLQARVSG
jgi:hypothetical protein